MDYKHLEELLDRYWNGNTTLEEEEEIRSLFSEENTVEKFPTDAAWFQNQTELRKKQSSLSDTNVVHKLPHPLPKVEKSNQFGFFLRIAAAIVVLVTAGYLVRQEIIRNPDQKDVITDSFEDPEKAFEETKRALMMLSKNLGKGKAYANSVTEFSKAEDKIKNTLED